MRYRKSTGGERPPGMHEEFLRALRPDHQSKGGRKRWHKSEQLCRQAQRALNLALAGECHDDLLREVYVETVTSSGDSGTLVVGISIPAGASLVDVLEKLDRARGLLRTSIAQAITRKRVPELIFVPVVPEVDP